MRVLVGLLIAIFSLADHAFAQSEADEVLGQLSKIRLDKNQIYSVRDIAIRRDTLSIFLNRGTIAFLEPVMGKVTGFVFIGSGEIVSVPPDAIEKQQVFRFTRSPVLNESFISAIFRFSDNTYEEILKEYSQHAQEEVTPEEIARLAPWENVVADRAASVNYRLLSAYIDPPNVPFFIGELNSEKHGPFNVIYDERFVEEVAIIRVNNVNDQPGTPSTDVWANYNKRSEARNVEGASHENRAVLDVRSYEIDATISPTAEMQVTAIIRARVLQNGHRLFGFDLSRALRVSSVALESGAAVPFYQQGSLNSFMVVLPEPLRSGDEIGLRISYSGNVIERRGNGIFLVDDRGLWYPRGEERDRAGFDLTFHFPAAFELVATGRKTREWTEGGLHHSNWKSEGDFPVAGFNFGDFTTLSDDKGGAAFPIFVSTNNDIESVFKEIAVRQALQQEQSMRDVGPRPVTPRSLPPPAVGPVVVSPDYSVFSTKAMAESILKEVRATVDYFSDILGPYPFKTLTVSQVPNSSSQGWPSLVYLSTLSFFDSEQRVKLGWRSDDDFIATELVRAHEIAHQWFGNKVGWKSYHDQWISEGFSNYAAAMFIENKYPRTTRMRQILDNARVRLSSLSGGGTYESIGPLWLGQRLSSSLSPDGYSVTIYSKGTWVAHMLRTLMQVEGANPDEAFLKMVREFLQTFDGKDASTFDLKHVAEKYMTKSMDLRGDGKLDWFFDQWVFDTGIPSYAMSYKVEPARDGFIVAGSIKQTGVPDGFIMPVPLYADGTLLGRVVVSDEDGDFRFVSKTRPTTVSLDPQGTILTRNADQ